MLPDFKGDSVPICKFKHKVNTYSAFLYLVEHVACKGLISIEDSHIFKYALNTETRLKFKESLQKKYCHHSFTIMSFKTCMAFFFS